MGVINLPTTFSPNTTISSSEVNSNFTTIYNEFNGSIAAANLATDSVTTAKIADSNVTTAKIADDAVTAAKLNWAATGANAGIWWEELGRTTLGSAGDTISVASLPARKYLKILYSVIPTGNVDTYIAFNNDGGTNYSQTTSATFAASATVTSGTQISIDSGVPATYFKGVGDIINISTINKLLHAVTVQTSTAGAANAPTSLEIMGKWVNTTDSISRIDLINTSTGSFDTGSELVVLGHN